MKIIIAPDSFKGSLTAREAAEAMQEGILRALPDAQCVLVPMADGGELCSHWSMPLVDSLLLHV